VAKPATNGEVIEAEIAWFERVLDLRFRIHAGEAEGDVLALAPPPPLPDAQLPYADSVRQAELSPAERLILVLAALPHLRPQALDPLLIQNQSSERRFTEFGGLTTGPHCGFRPTRETALFLLGGESMDRRLEAIQLFAPDRPLQARHILELGDEPGEEGPWLPLAINHRWIGRLTSGAPTPPRRSASFPAQRIESRYSLSDLVLPESVLEEIAAALTWARREAELLADWGLARHVRAGYRMLFHGPPGTGKTVTAAVLGRELDLPIYRVDLSRVVSKWIGETEKNLATLFDEAADGDMLLFFDEADALFGKRGDTRTANDRHANQQIGYLLQRIEESPGLIILASNLRQNIDSAFARRFQAIVHFPVPDTEARAQLWRRAFAGLPSARQPRVDLPSLARQHELAGGSIVNVVRHACTLAAAADRAVSQDDIRHAIARELKKEGRFAA
jgi:hypothetical protein